MTKDDVIRLKQLKQKADEMQTQIFQLSDEAQALTGEKDDSGYTFDFMLNDVYTVDELLEKLGLEVE